MRLAVMLTALLLSSGCVGPHVTGSLWVLQNVQMDQELFRQGDAARAQQAHRFELGLADEALAAERTRLEQALQTCPTRDRQPVAVSVGDRVRDGVRIRADDDAARTQRVAQMALADWRLRRANATGDFPLCEAARTALAGQSGTAHRNNAIDALGEASVTRGQGAMYEGDPRTALSLYASGAVDGVTANGPLPQYLAAVYGGTVMQTVQAATQAEAAAGIVDEIAAAYPEYEPDALWAALSAQR